ncbi:HTH domain-containing protein [Aquimarina sp. U1-2]|uniref:HTH domain-containing protein n=1 Tax=Aquimarina sp. U1-2 TaxID=2823141 RepID=UPI001AEC91E9|nr:HTH domain-containing protein [Aquimarina sp. U1-2]MBP2831193.1 HTH domain-containing protein [Aquimarina sp. U1-2]
MKTINNQIETIARIDRLIRMQATGTPEALASRLGVSKATLYRTLNVMKDLNAPITYEHDLKSFVYEKAVGFRFGFYVDSGLVSGTKY